MSFVNSAIYDRCLVWRGDLSVVLDKAKVRGLWSVNTVKDRPSRKWRKCLIEENIASNSRSKAEYFLSDDVRVFEKNAIGFHSDEPLGLWASSAPMATSDASTVRAVSEKGEG